MVRVRELKHSTSTSTTWALGTSRTFSLSTSCSTSPYPGGVTSLPFSPSLLSLSLGGNPGGDQIRWLTTPFPFVLLQYYFYLFEKKEKKRRKRNPKKQIPPSLPCSREPSPSEGARSEILHHPIPTPPREKCPCLSQRVRPTQVGLSWGPRLGRGHFLPNLPEFSRFYLLFARCFRSGISPPGSCRPRHRCLVPVKSRRPPRDDGSNVRRTAGLRQRCSAKCSRCPQETPSAATHPVADIVESG